MPTFDTAALGVADTRIKTLIDEYADSDLCSCKDDTQAYVNKLLIVRKGIDYDIAATDVESATEKLELINTMLDGGKDFDCNCS